MGESRSAPVVMVCPSPVGAVCSQYQVSHVFSAMVSDWEGRVCFDLIEVFCFGDGNVSLAGIRDADGSRKCQILPSVTHLYLNRRCDSSVWYGYKGSEIYCGFLPTV